MSDTPDTPTDLSARVLDAIVNSDCFCAPGDPTCEDWPTAEARWKAQHEAVMRVVSEEVSQLRTAGDELEAITRSCFQTSRAADVWRSVREGRA